MAQRTEVILIDDVDGGKADETIEFSLDGVTYEIDLSDKNASKLRDDIADWAVSARRIGGKKKKGGNATARPDRKQYLADLREWASQNGYQVSERGRVPVDVEQAYNAHLSAS